VLKEPKAPGYILVPHPKFKQPFASRQAKWGPMVFSKPQLAQSSHQEGMQHWCLFLDGFKLLFDHGPSIRILIEYDRELQNPGTSLTLSTTVYNNNVMLSRAV
jgi:hypothetical protein